MTFSAEKEKAARYPFLIIKLEVDNPITAGGAEYHCLGRAPVGYHFHESIRKDGFDPAPTKLTPGEGLGYRGTIRITLDDFDLGENGTYWGKLLANNPYYLDRPVKVYEGFYEPGTTFSWDNFVEKLYFWKKLQGPDSKRKIVITAADPLTLLDDDQSVIDFDTDAELASAMTSTTAGTVDIGDSTNFPSGGGGVGGYIVIDDEIMYTSGTYSSTEIVITLRGQFGTEAVDHEAGAPVRRCYTFEDENIVDVIRDVIENHTPIDHATFIPDTDWNTERDTFLSGSNATGVLLPGDSVKDFIETASSEFRLSIWFADEAQEIRLKAIGPLVSAAKRYNINEHILKDGEDVTRDPQKAVTDVIVHFGRVNHLADEEEFSNYGYHYYVPNTEAAAGHGKPKIKEIYAKYIPASGTATANRLADRVLSHLSLGEMIYKFRLDISHADLDVGQVVEAYTPLIQGTDGLPVPTSFMVIERDRIAPNVYEYKAVRTGYSLGSRYRKIAPSALAGLTYTTATTEQKATYLFIAGSSGEFSNTDPGHWIY